LDCEQRSSATPWHSDGLPRAGRAVNSFGLPVNLVPPQGFIDAGGNRF
jgi:hypothetical protein